MSVNEISASSLLEMSASITSGSIRLVDVREEHEFNAGHIPGAISVPLSVLVERIEELRGDSPLYLVCQVGGRSMRACEYAQSLGIEATNIGGGTTGWIDAGGDIVSDTV